MDNIIALEKTMTTVAIIVGLSATILSGFLAWVVKRGAEGRSKYKFEIWLNSPSPKYGLFGVLADAFKRLTRKPEKRMK